ncbi:hypothetical protein PIROE2DRAFT_63759 [Piromyces sp. E2]|nr:hypothetical protein PIROE2DRAFT_63759 [Piromyces sp. E2]|eukprot:OUM59456.1 hypothetical protein PIROE2DRAFT_63759 [Piromyces sp. E2]
MIELTSLFLDEIKNIKVENLRKDDKKMILYNENKLKKQHQLSKSRHDNKKINTKNVKESVNNINNSSNNSKNNNKNKDNENNQKNVTTKQKATKHHQSAQQIEMNLMSIEEGRNNFLKLCELLIRLKKKKNIEKEKVVEKDDNRYNSLHKHIWNIYCVNDIFFRIINKFFIFQNDENGSELMSIVSSMNESSKKLNISSIITQLCSNFINMLIDIRTLNVYSNEYLYLITMMLTNVEKSLKKYYRKPTYWIKLIDDIVKVLFPSHFLESFNQPNENHSNENSIAKEVYHEESDIHKSTTTSTDDISEKRKHNKSNSSLHDAVTTTMPSIPPKENNLNTNSTVPPIFLSNKDSDVSSNKLSLPSLTSNPTSSTFLPPISSTSSTLPSISSSATAKIPNPEKKMKRSDSLEPLEPISKPSSPLQPISNVKSLSRSSSSSSLDNGEEFYQVLTKNTIVKNDTVDIKNEVKLFLVKSIIKNIEETIRDCDYIPLNLCSIPLPSLKNHKRSVSVIQKKNSLINLPSVKTPLPPTMKKPKNQSIQKKRPSISNSKPIPTTVDSNQKSGINKQETPGKPEKPEKLEYQKNSNNELEITMDDTTDSEIYDDFDSESSLDSRNKESGSEDDDEKESEIRFNKKTNIYEQETIYFIQFKLKDYIESVKEYIGELSNIRMNYKNYLVLTIQNIMEKHMLLLQSYYKKIASTTQVDSSKPYFSRQRQHTAIEPSINNRSFSKVEPIKNPILLQKSSSLSRNSLRDPLLIQNRLKIYSTLPSSSSKTPLHVNVTNIVLEPIKRNRTKIPSIKYDSKVKRVNPLK